MRNENVKPEHVQTYFPVVSKFQSILVEDDIHPTLQSRTIILMT